MASGASASYVLFMEPDGSGFRDVAIDRARPQDARAIAVIHVEVWRNAYPGLLPDHTLAGLSVGRLAPQYEAAIRFGGGVLVARTAQGRVVGFATASPREAAGPAEGEVHTLYVHDDWRERGIGRLLLKEAARNLLRCSCRSLFLWVLADNPSRWFYQHLGGRPALRGTTRVGGRLLPQLAMVWDRIELLADGD
jgi:L-amino acid N-acyltransferase YncA